MRIPSSVFAAGRYVAVFTLIAGSVVLISAPKKAFSVYDKARYADPSVVQYVLPGLAITINSANIASDGTISVNYSITDGNGDPLDLAGIQTPGAVSLSFLAAYIPQGQAQGNNQFWNFILKSTTATVGLKGTTTQPSSDSGGTTTTVALGQYTYTYHTKAVAEGGGAFDPTATTRIGIYGSRNLTEFDLGTNYASKTFDFVPNGSAVTSTRDVINTVSCNQCHQALSFHGGSRQGLDLCIMCHEPQNSDPATGNSLDAKVLYHKIHMGSQLPSVQAGTPYQIVGYQNAVSDWSTEVFPANPQRCTMCHQQTTGATQATAYKTNPTRAACGACHDDVNFATGVNHPGGVQIDDSECATCHIPQGELEFDASIVGAHQIADESPLLPGINFTLVSVQNGGAGGNPTVNFTVTDNNGNGIPMSSFTGGSNSLSLTMAGPTSDFGYTNFGATTPGYVTESATGASCSSSGSCQYTFTHAVPAGATGTYQIGIEGRIAMTLYPGTTASTSATESGLNQVIDFSVDGSPVTPRRLVVQLANCDGCHSNLELHGNLRNNTLYCVMCHNPSNTDASTRPTSTVAAYQTLPPQGINFALLVHKVHTGALMPTDFGTDYIVIGHGGAVSDFGDAFASVPASIPNTGVLFPVMGPTGAVQDTAKCAMCHYNDSNANFPEGKNNVTDPEGLISPVPATTSACTACHQNKSALAHAQAQTDPTLGESCDVCHGTGMAFDVDAVHAGK